MVKLKIARVAAAAAASAGLIASFSGVAGASSLNGNLDGGGCGCNSQQFDHHHNKPSKTFVLTDTDQTNNVDVSNSTDQNAYTGNVTVNGGGNHGQVWGDNSWGNNNHNNKGNSTVNATSGDAMNSNSFNATVNATNNAPSSTWVPSSSSKGSTTIVKTDTDQTNNISVDNQTTQNAYTGNVTVNGGSGKGRSTVNATSGDASNYNSTSVTVNATNK